MTADKTTINIDGKDYCVDRILVEGSNYVKLRSFEEAGYFVKYHNKKPYIINPSIDPKTIDNFMEEVDIIKRFNLTSDEMVMLERLVYAEARGEGVLGMAMVASVVFNRMESKRFPNNLRDIIYAPKQFACLNDGNYDKAVCTKDTAEAVNMALLEDKSEGATYFRTVKGAEGSWHNTALHLLFTYKNHNFYKER